MGHFSSPLLVTLVPCFITGPALGSFLYTVGGFTLPFFVVGSISLVPSFCLCLVIPDIDPDTVNNNNNNNNNKAPASDRDLTFVSLLRVSIL